jgi:hypothetical protein
LCDCHIERASSVAIYEMERQSSWLLGRKYYKLVEHEYCWGNLMRMQLCNGKDKDLQVCIWQTHSLLHANVHKSCPEKSASMKSWDDIYFLHLNGIVRLNVACITLEL